MNLSIQDLDDGPETIDTHVSVPCGKTLRKRYEDCGNRLKQISPKKKKLLTKTAREALDSVLTRFEQLLDQAEKAS